MKSIHLQGVGRRYPSTPTSEELARILREYRENYIGGLELQVDDRDSFPRISRQMTFYIHSQTEMAAIYRDHTASLGFVTLGDVSRENYITVSDGCGGEGLLEARNLVPLELGIKYAIEFLETGELKPDEHWEPNRYYW